MRQAAVDQIASFGQTPPQLFDQPHPARQPAEIDAVSLPQSPIQKLPARLNIPLAFIDTNSPSSFEAVVVDCNQCITPLTLNATGPVTTTTEAKIKSAEVQRRLGEPIEQNVQVSKSCFALIPDSKTIAVSGFWDNSIKTFSQDGAKHSGTYFGHIDVVTCISVSPDGKVIASGGRDAIVQIWDIKPAAADVFLEARSTLVGHEHSVTCVAVDLVQDTVVSGSHGLCLVHSLRGDLLHSISHSDIQRLSLITITSNASFVAFYRDKASPSLVSYHVNGRVLATVVVDEQLMDLVSSKSGEFVISGGFSQRLCVRLVHNLETVFTYDACGSSIRTILLARNETLLLAGLASGEVFFFAANEKTWSGHAKKLAHVESNRSLAIIRRISTVHLPNRDRTRSVVDQ